MKKSILTLGLLLTSLFVVGCNENDSKQKNK